jgi:plasmid stability protein
LNLTIRNIAENVIKKIRILSQMKKRSLNNEILLILENGVQEEVKHFLKIKRKISKNIQVQIWERLSREWQDDRSTEDIIKDIYNSRTLGREFQL